MTPQQQNICMFIIPNHKTSRQVALFASLAYFTKKPAQNTRLIVLPDTRGQVKVITMEFLLMNLPFVLRLFAFQR